MTTDVALATPLGADSKSVALELFPSDAAGDALDLGRGQGGGALLYRLAQQTPNQRGGRDVLVAGALSQLLVQLPVDAQVHRHVQGAALLDSLSLGGLGGLGFFHGDLRADRLVPRAARHLLG